MAKLSNNRTNKTALKAGKLTSQAASGSLLQCYYSDLRTTCVLLLATTFV